MTAKKTLLHCMIALCLGAIGLLHFAVAAASHPSPVPVSVFHDLDTGQSVSVVQAGTAFTITKMPGVESLGHQVVNHSPHWIKVKSESGQTMTIPVTSVVAVVTAEGVPRRH